MRASWLVLMVILALSGCGGGGSNNSNGGAAGAESASTGQTFSCLKAPTVVGLPFYTDVDSGVTDSEGCFFSTPGYAVTFFVGVRSGIGSDAIVQGNVLGTVNAGANQEIDVASLSADPTTQANIVAFLLVSRSNDVMTDGIVLNPRFLLQAAKLPKFDFSKDISTGLLSVQAAGIASNDGGTHAIATSQDGQGVLNGGALCSIAGKYGGSAQSYSSVAEANIATVSTQFLVVPPIDSIVGEMDVSGNTMGISGTLPFEVDNALSLTNPSFDVSGGIGGDLRLYGSLAAGQRFSGTALFAIAGQTGTATVPAYGSGLYYSTRRFVGGTIGGGYGAAIEVMPSKTPGSFDSIANLYGVPGADSQITATVGPDGTGLAEPTSDGLSYKVQIQPWNAATITVYAQATAWITINLTGCMR